MIVTFLTLILAGIMNGSFVIPVKYIDHSIGRIWFYYSIVGLAIIPWVILAFVVPNFIDGYLTLPVSIFSILFLSGFIFGLGQLTFAKAIKSLGIALSFTINLGIGVTIGSLFVVALDHDFFMRKGQLVTLATILIVASLVFYYFANKKMPQQFSNAARTSHYRKNWLLVIFTGITSGLQNIAFIIVAFHSKGNLHIGNSFWVWPPFLLAAAIPIFVYFLYQMKKTALHCDEVKAISIKEFLLISLMGFLFTGSLAVYSIIMSQLDAQQQEIGWPTFMVAIILTSQIWGLLLGEMTNFSKKQKIYWLCSVGLLLGAILVLAS